ncbi:MAG TPA: hypothetical protein PLU67_02550 [Candidatus Kapabacteria bacterium]|nr:hypothetical protein [Candidatus Kapabacteria bacterium]
MWCGCGGTGDIRRREGVWWWRWMGICGSCCVRSVGVCILASRGLWRRHGGMARDCGL